MFNAAVLCNDVQGSVRQLSNVLSWNSPPFHNSSLFLSNSESGMKGGKKMDGGGGETYMDGSAY